MSVCPGNAAFGMHGHALVGGRDAHHPGVRSLILYRAGEHAEFFGAFLPDLCVGFLRSLASDSCAFRKSPWPFRNRSQEEMSSLSFKHTRSTSAPLFRSGHEMRVRATRANEWCARAARSS
jgi:hypothetical protein